MAVQRGIQPMHSILLDYYFTFLEVLILLSLIGGVGLANEKGFVKNMAILRNLNVLPTFTCTLIVVQYPLLLYLIIY